MPPVRPLSYHIACRCIRCCQYRCYDLRRRVTILQNTALMQITALVYAVPVHLIKEGSEAHAEPLGRLPAVARRRPQGGGDGVALGDLHRLTECSATRLLLRTWRGGTGERFPPKIRRLQDLSVRQHRRPLDGVLQRAHVAR